MSKIFFNVLGLNLISNYSLLYLYNLNFNDMYNKDNCDNKNIFNKILYKDFIYIDDNIELKDVFLGKSDINKKFNYLTTPFNRKIQQIYNISDVKYKLYENYDFNKLSDIFLNIHIFVN